MRREPTPTGGSAGPMRGGIPNPPLLDHTSFPVIFDTILALAPTASLAVLRQTSRALRDRVRPLLFRHVLFLSAPGPDPRTIHILTAAPPHLYLGTLSLSPPATAPTGAPAELAHTTTADMYAVPPTWDLSRLLPRLRVLRRLGESRNRLRFVNHLPPAPTVVDRLDLTLTKFSGCAQRWVAAPYGTKRHIVHAVLGIKHPALYIYGCDRVEIVLHPAEDCSHAEATPDICLDRLLRAGARRKGAKPGADEVILVGLDRFPSISEDSWTTCEKCEGKGQDPCSHSRQEEYATWRARFGTDPESAPETMESYFVSSPERIAVGAEVSLRACW